eukprot:13848096-Ditylum_brightwellii.AAC.1
MGGITYGREQHALFQRFFGKRSERGEGVPEVTEGNSTEAHIPSSMGKSNGLDMRSNKRKIDKIHQILHI